MGGTVSRVIDDRRVQHEAFYATTAQVIPLLLIVVMVERRMLDPGTRLSEPVPHALRFLLRARPVLAKVFLHVLVRFLLLFYLVAAEAVAIDALAAESDKGWKRWYIAIAIAIELGFLLAVALFGATHDDETHPRTDE